MNQTQIFNKKIQNINSNELLNKLKSIRKRIKELINNFWKNIQTNIQNNQYYIQIFLNKMLKGNLHIFKENTTNIIETIEFNQSKLENFQGALNSLLNIKYLNISRKQEIKTINRQIKYQQLSNKKQLYQNVEYNQEIENHYIINIDPIRSIVQKYQFREKIYTSFQSNIEILPYSKYVQVYDKVYILGGSKIKQNIKVTDILQYNVQKKEIILVGDLIEGRSSHGIIYVHPYVYSVGGHKNYQIITKSCQKFNVITKISSSISQLNYCVSCASLVHTGGYIYKFGGIGQKFKFSGLSPYIERYDIFDDFWQVINPILDSGLSIQNFHLLSYPYVCKLEDDKIFIFGGYDTNKVFHKSGFIMKIENENYSIDKIQENLLPFEEGNFHINGIYYEKSIYYLIGKVNKEKGLFSDKSIIRFDGSSFDLL